VWASACCLKKDLQIASRDVGLKKLFVVTDRSTVHTTNSIQGSNFNILKQEEPVIRKLILRNVDNAMFLAKGSIKSTIPVNVNAKIINQLTNSRVDTTQGIDMIKKLIAIELTDALNTIAPSFASHYTSTNKSHC